MLASGCWFYDELSSSGTRASFFAPYAELVCSIIKNGTQIRTWRTTLKTTTAAGSASCWHHSRMAGTPRENRCSH